MKTLKQILIVTFLTLMVNSAFSIVPDTTSQTKMPDQVKKTLMRKIQFPAEASKQKIEGEVAICFKITEEGTILINCINGHPVLKKAVNEKLNQIVFQKKMACANKNMYVKFKFDIESI